MAYSWKEFDDVSSIFFEGREMEYRFVPAELDPHTAPTLIILHGHGNYPPARARYPDWNVFNPLDNFGFNGLGSWWLGEKNTMFTIKLFDIALQTALSSIQQSIASSKLFIYGSSMGGYGALLHGVRINALGVYANVPQVRLLGSTYSEMGMKKYFGPIFSSNQVNRYNDLRDFLREFKTHPLYFLCENRYGQENYLEEHCMSLIHFLNERKLNYHLEIMPKKGHDKNRRISEVKKLFEEYCL